MVRSRIDANLCVRCGDCLIACRDGGHRAILAGDDRTPRVDDEKCVGCGLCRLVCPVPGCVRLEALGPAGTRPASAGLRRRSLTTKRKAVVRKK